MGLIENSKNKKKVTNLNLAFPVFLQKLIRRLRARGGSLGLVRRWRERRAYDERVLGSSKFVREVVEEASERRSSELITIKFE